MSGFAKVFAGDEDNRGLKYSFYLLIFILLTLFFAFLPITFGYDWFILRSGVQRLFAGEEPYLMLHTVEGQSAVFSPPWVLLMISPLALLPQKLGWAFINSLSIFAMIYLCRRHQINRWLTLLILFSPPMIYNSVHGNLDAVLLLLTLAPVTWLPLVAISKPQLLFGVVFRFLHERPQIWLRAALISAPLLLLSFLPPFGLWPLKVLALAAEQFNIAAVPHSPLFSIWPLQLVVAIGLIAVGYERKDYRFYLAASPFMSSYATVGSFLGLIVMLCAGLKWWQSSLIILSWWVVSLVFN